MKLELERQDFLKAWNIAEKPASTKTTDPSLSCIFITASDDDQVTLEATDLKTSVKCNAKGVNIIEPGTAAVPVAMFGNMMKKSSADKITLDVNSERGFLEAGRNKMRFTIVPVDEFPKIPSSGSAEKICEITASELGRLILEGSSAASQPADFPKYLGTCLLRTTDSSIRAVSTDGKRLSLSNMLCNVAKNEDMLMPSPALKELGKTIAGYNDQNVVILADGSTVWFALEDVEFSIRKIESVFPNYERILNNEVRTTLRISRDELSAALDRIDIIAKTTAAHIMALSLEPDGNIRLTARAPELGTAIEVLSANIEGSYMQLGFNVAYFQDGLKVLGAGDVKIEFSNEEGQTRMYRAETEDFLYMLMPARLTSQDSMTEEEIGDFSASYRAEQARAEAEAQAQAAQEAQEAQEQEQESSNEDQDNSEAPF